MSLKKRLLIEFKPIIISLLFIFVVAKIYNFYF